jgi:hypothetical protein
MTLAVVRVGGLRLRQGFVLTSSIRLVVTRPAVTLPGNS